MIIFINTVWRNISYPSSGRKNLCDIYFFQLVCGVASKGSPGVIGFYTLSSYRG